MSEMEDKLNKLLDDPETMGRIMQMAQQLSGGTGTLPPPSSPDLSGFDPQTITKLLPLVKELQTPNSQATQLLYALRPYLKEEKQGKIDRAVKLAHLIHIGKKAFSDWGLDLV